MLNEDKKHWLNIFLTKKTVYTNFIKSKWIKSIFDTSGDHISHTDLSFYLSQIDEYLLFFINIILLFEVEDIEQD